MTLNLTVNKAHGSLLRVLGLAERRGYMPTAMELLPHDSSSYNLTLTVQSDRPVDQLVQRLRNLYDVRHVETQQ